MLFVKIVVTLCIKPCSGQKSCFTMTARDAGEQRTRQNQEKHGEKYTIGITDLFMSNRRFFCGLTNMQTRILKGKQNQIVVYASINTIFTSGEEKCYNKLYFTTEEVFANGEMVCGCQEGRF